MFGIKQKDIAAICDVTPRTVVNWKKKENIPLWAIKKLGLIVVKQEEVKP